MTQPPPLPIVHRVNTIDQLVATPPTWGVEVDLRDSGRHVVLNHEPFGTGERLEHYLARFRHRLIILNIKSEGIEQAVLTVVRHYRIRHYFLLDVTIPKLVALGRRGEPHLAARFSEYESIESCLAMAKWIEWIWIDCFTRLPLTPGIVQQLRTHFKLCLCSPELVGHSATMIAAARRLSRRIPIDAVCTGHPELWSTPC